MRPLIVLLVLAFAVLQFRLWVLDGGMLEVWRLERQVEERTEENRRLAERNAALSAEVQDLKNGLAAAEERARSELGMVLPDESFYQIMPYEALSRALRREAAGGAAEPAGGASEALGLGDVRHVDAPPTSPPPSSSPQQDVDGAGAAVSAVR